MIVFYDIYLLSLWFQVYLGEWGFFDIDNVQNDFFFVDVQKADAGNLTCEVWEKVKEGDQWIKDELVAMKSVPIQVRSKKL